MLLSKVRAFAAKVEATAGTVEALTAAEGAYNTYNLKIQPQIDVATREAQGGFGRISSVPGARKGIATFRTDAGYTGSAIPTWASVLLPACGVVASSTTFTPRSEIPGSNVKTVTIGGYVNGKFKSIYGAMGNARFIMVAGQLIYIDWTFTGIYADESDVALIAPTYPTTQTPLRFAGGATSWNSANVCLQQATFDFGNVVTGRECTTSVAGYDSFVVTDRIPKVTGNPEAKLVATRPVYNQFISMTEAALSFTLDGPGNSTIVISAPKAQIVNGPQEGERNGIVTDEIEWQLNKNGSTADQEFSIVFNHIV
jgi:hypothetical protein